MMVSEWCVIRPTHQAFRLDGQRRRPVRQGVAEDATAADEALGLLADRVAGDGRQALTSLEVAVALAEDRASVHLSTDWRDAVDATDGPDPDPALVSEDHIHPVADGEVRLAQAMEEAASRECR